MKKAWHGSLLALFTFAFVATSASLPVRAGEPDLRTLHNAYVGHALGDGKIATLSYDTTWTDAKGTVFVKDHTVRAGLVFRDDEHLAKQNTQDSVGFTGTTFWYSDINGFPTTVGGNSVSLRYGWNLIEADALAALPWQYQHDDVVDDAKVAVERTRLSTGMQIDIFVDKASGAYRRIIIDPDGVYQTIVESITYTEIQPGLRAISGYHLGHTKVALLNYSLNPLLSNADLQPPAKTATWTFGTAPVPVTFTKDRILIHATVNGVAGTFLLDTGAAGIFLSKRFGERLHLTSTGHSDTWTLYGSERINVGKVDTMQFADSTLSNVLVYYGMSDTMTDGSDGLIGYGMLGGAFATLDLKNKTFRLSDPAAQGDLGASGGTVVPTGFSGGEPTVQMLVNNMLTVDSTIDTGDPEGIVIPDSIATGYRLHFYRPADGYCGKLDSVAVAGIRYDSPPACMTDSTDDRWILVGLDFIRRFDRIDFDYAAGQIVLYPKKV